MAPETLMLQPALHGVLKIIEGHTQAEELGTGVLGAYRAVPSKEALRRWLPSLENSTLVTPCEWAFSNRRRHCPVRTRHTCHAPPGGERQGCATVSAVLQETRHTTLSGIRQGRNTVSALVQEAVQEQFEELDSSCSQASSFAQKGVFPPALFFPPLGEGRGEELLPGFFPRPGRPLPRKASSLARGRGGESRGGTEDARLTLIFPSWDPEASISESRLHVTHSTASSCIMKEAWGTPARGRGRGGAQSRAEGAGGTTESGTG